MTVQLLNADCMEYMADLPDKAFDLAIVDPPYGIGESGDNESRNRVASNNYKAKEWDNEPPNFRYFEELSRVSKNMIVFGANHFMGHISFASLDHDISSPCWIVWDKDNGASDFADCELAWTTFKTAVRKFKFQWAGMLQQDMKNKENRIHPTQKPVALYRWILQTYAKPGQRILDTHLGSGSSAVAAHYFGCDFVGTELDPDYYAAAVKRFDNETSQIAMELI